MVVDKELKKRVTEDWLYTFPELTAFTQNKLYKVVGCSVIGIELVKPPFMDGYSPYFAVYSLCGNRMGSDVKACLDGPILLKDFKNKKGLQYDIPYEKHSVLFEDAIDCVKRQMPLSFKRDISFKELAMVLDEYSQMRPLSAAPNSYLQAAFQEAKFKMALYIGTLEAQCVLKKINERKWDEKHFKAFGVDIDIWLQNLQEVIDNRDAFLRQIEINKQDKKIAKLQSSKLIP